MGRIEEMKQEKYETILFELGLLITKEQQDGWKYCGDTVLKACQELAKDLANQLEYNPSFYMRIRDHFEEKILPIVKGEL